MQSALLRAVLGPPGRCQRPLAPLAVAARLLLVAPPGGRLCAADGQPRARALATARASSALAIADPLFELLPLEPPAFPELLTPGTHAVMLGIDPDISGAIAVLQWRNPPAAPGAVASANTSAPALDSLQLSVHDMPVELWEMGTRAKRQPSAQSLISLLQQHTGPDPGAGAGVVPAAPAAATAEPAAQPTAPEPPMVVRAVVEYSQPLSMSGKHAWYGNGFAMGLLHGLLVVMGVPYVRVHASTWKRQMGLYKQGKEGSLALASQAFPALAGTHLRRKKDHGRAEAILVAAYGLGLRARALAAPASSGAVSEAAEEEASGLEGPSSSEEEEVPEAQGGTGRAARAPGERGGRAARAKAPRGGGKGQAVQRLLDEDLWIST